MTDYTSELFTMKMKEKLGKRENFSLNCGQ